jgi:hypothetical protein
LIACAICSSVNRLFFMTFAPHGNVNHAEISTSRRSGFLGEGQ